MGGGHDRHGRPRRRPAGGRHLLRLLATTCGVRSGWRPSPVSTSSTRGPTTRSASARTVPPTSPSSSWPPCGPCPASGSSVRPTPTRRPRPGGSPWTPTGPPPSILTRQEVPVLAETAELAAGRACPGAPTCCPTRRTDRPRSCSSGPAARSGCAWTPPACWPRRAPGPGWCPSPRGTCSPSRATTTGTTSCRPGVPTPGGRGGQHVRLGAVRRRLAGHRPLRGLGPGRGRPARVRLRPGARGRPGHRAGRPELAEPSSPQDRTAPIRTLPQRTPERTTDDHDSTTSTTSRARAPGSTTSGATGSRTARWPAWSTRASGGSPPTRPSSPRPSAARTPTTTSSAR